MSKFNPTLANPYSSFAADDFTSDNAIATDTGEHGDKSAYAAPTTETAILAADMQAYALSCDDFAQSRTRISQASPWLFYAQPKAGGRKSAHQIAGSYRAESCTVYMPSRALYETTGNPYPNSISAPGVSCSSPTYDYMKPSVLVAHVVFNMLRKSAIALSASSIYFGSDAIAQASALLGKPLHKSANNSKNWLLDCVTHILRDLENCGLAIAQDHKRNQYTAFVIQPTLTH